MNCAGVMVQLRLHTGPRLKCAKTATTMMAVTITAATATIHTTSLVTAGQWANSSEELLWCNMGGLWPKVLQSQEGVHAASLSIAHTTHVDTTLPLFQARLTAGSYEGKCHITSQSTVLQESVVYVYIHLNDSVHLPAI